MVLSLDLTQSEPSTGIAETSEVIDLLDAEIASPWLPVEFNLQSHGVEVVEFIPKATKIKDIELQHDEDIVCLGGDTGEVRLKFYLQKMMLRRDVSFGFT